jgi:hypothetical protein
MFKIVIVVISCLLFINVSFGQTKFNSLEEMIQSDHRPTMLDYMHFYKYNLPKQNPIKSPYTHYTGYDIEPLKQKAIGMSNILVYLAKISDNYFFLPMGRDASFAADIVEGFWLNKKIKNKMHRINGSTKTIKGSYDDHDRQEVFADYAQQIGLSSKRYKHNLQTAILFDHSINGLTSQAHLFGIALKNRLIEVNNNLDQKFIDKSIVMMTTGNADVLISDISDLNHEDYLKAIKNRDSGLVYIGVHDELREFMYDSSGEWHGTFTQFTFDEKGKILENPGVRKNEDQRRSKKICTVATL